MILKTIRVEFAIKDLRSVGKNNIVNEVDDSTKVNGIKCWVDSQVKLSKSNNKIRLSLAKT